MQLLLLLAIMFAPLSQAQPAATNTWQSLVDAARPGQTIILSASTMSGDLVLRVAGTAAAPITLRGVAGTKLSGKLRIIGGAAYWNVEDLTIVSKEDGARIEAPAHHITLRRLDLSGGTGYGVRVGTDVTNVTIESSHIHNFDAGSADAHGVGIMTASNIVVRNCDIHNTSGDAVQVNTPDYPGYKRWASNVLIENNRLHETRENAVDIKSSRNVTVRGNQMWGFRAVSTSTGMALQVQYDSQDVVIERNQIWDAEQGIEISRGKKNGQVYPVSPQRVRISNNLIRNVRSLSSVTEFESPTDDPTATLSELTTFDQPAAMAPADVSEAEVQETNAVTEAAAAGLTNATFLPFVQQENFSSPPTEDVAAKDKGNALIVLTSSDIKLYNNTIIGATGSAIYVGTSSESGPASRVDIRNNVLQGTGADLAFSPVASSVSGLVVDYNHYVNSAVNGKTFAAWLSQGFEKHASTGQVSLDSGYLPKSGSSLIDSGTNVGLSYKGGAPDRGWGE